MPDLDRLDVVALRHVLTSFRDAVRDHAATLDLLNVYPVPDGDTGTNMARTLDAVVTEMESAATDLDATCDAISHGSLMGARGNSGVILSQILRGVAATLKRPGDHVDPAAGARRFADALAAAATGAYQAVLEPVEGTILTVVRESAEAATAAADAGMALIEVVEAARAAGRDSLARTPDLLPVLRDAGVVDAGGAGFVLFLDAALHVLTGRPLPEAVAAVPAVPLVSGVSSLDGQLGAAEQRYEVMYLCDIADDVIDRFKIRWGAIGDSVVVVGGDGLWNCHVHTNDIGAAVEVALDLGGRPRRIRVTDLFEEVAEGHTARDASLSGSDGGGEGDVGLCAVVAVASGAGLATLFRDLGVAEVVMGGQTSNPSTAELLAAAERVPASSVVLLPNNKNIIAVARQVDGLTTKAVSVVPTRSMPEALAALMVFDARVDHLANERRMTEAIAPVATGEVTRAVRDSPSAVGQVAEGDWIGLVAGDGIVAVADHLLGASTALLDHLIDESHELLTMITGSGATAGTTAALEGWVSEHHAHIGVEVHEGGQPLYPYLFGVE